MRFYLFLYTFILFSMGSFAKTVELDLTLKYEKGKTVLENREKIKASLGKKLILSRNNLYAEILPTEFDSKRLKLENDNLLLLKAKVYEIVGKKKVLISRSKVIAAKGEAATMSVQKEDGKKLILKVKAN